MLRFCCIVSTWHALNGKQVSPKYTKKNKALKYSNKGLSKLFNMKLVDPMGPSVRVDLSKMVLDLYQDLDQKVIRELSTWYFLHQCHKINVKTKY